MLWTSFTTYHNQCTHLPITLKHPHFFIFLLQYSHQFLPTQIKSIVFSCWTFTLLAHRIKKKLSSPHFLGLGRDWLHMPNLSLLRGYCGEIAGLIIECLYFSRLKVRCKNTFMNKRCGYSPHGAYLPAGETI